jgi:hypothetical protein
MSVKTEFDPKNMPFRRLGPSGLRVPVFSLGGCKQFDSWDSTIAMMLRLPRRADARRHRCW